MRKAGSLDERLSIVSESIMASSSHNYAAEDIKAAAHSYYNKLLAADAYTPACKLEQRILLIKAEQSATSALPVDYGLSDVCVDVDTMSSPGNHVNFITDDNSVKVARFVAQWFESH